MNTPLVTVLMAVYNGQQYLREAIDSILHQTFSDFELLIIDDASNDNSRKIAESYSDSRVRIVCNNHNLRLAGSLNRGLNLARGKYIARMDADDISLPARLEKQLAFMESHIDVGISGGWLRCFGDKQQLWDYPQEPGIIKCNLLFHNQLGHPTVIMRRKLMLEKGLYYNPEFRESEDYDLWSRCVEHFRLANLPEILLLYRWHERQASQARLAEQHYYHYLVCQRQLNRLGLKPSPEEIKIHLKIGFGKLEPVPAFINASRQWLLKIFKANLKYSYYNKLELSTVLESYWRKICLAAGSGYPSLIA